MAELSFESITRSVIAGSPVDGVLRFRATRPVRARDFTILLRGAENTSARVSSGKHSYTVRDAYLFLAHERSLMQVVASPIATELPPGDHRIPFRFIVPPGSPPSMSIGSAREGAAMSYVVEARINVPWWPDAVARSTVVVLPPHRSLGSGPRPTRGSRSWAGKSEAELLFRADPGAVEMGKSFTGEYRIENPDRKRIRKLTISLVRIVDWSAAGRRRAGKGPTFTLKTKIGIAAESSSGRFALPLPQHESATIPWTGHLIRVRWVVRVSLDVAWGFDAVFEIPLSR